MALVLRIIAKLMGSSAETGYKITAMKTCTYDFKKDNSFPNEKTIAHVLLSFGMILHGPHRTNVDKEDSCRTMKG